MKLFNSDGTRPISQGNAVQASLKHLQSSVRNGSNTGLSETISLSKSGNELSEQMVLKVFKSYLSAYGSAVPFWYPTAEVQLGY